MGAGNKAHAGTYKIMYYFCISTVSVLLKCASCSMPNQDKTINRSIRSSESGKERGALLEGATWFLGIGINTYKEFPSLNNAVKDIEDIKTVLLDTYNFAPDKTILLLNEEATKENIVDQLDRLAESVKPKDKLLIYYSGHGHLNQHTGLGYWIPYDAKRDKTSNYILNSTVRDYIKVIQARHILLISDSCFSGSLFVRGAKRSADIAMEELESIPSRWAICSGRHDEQVYDGEPGKNSPFAESILETLRKNEKRLLNVAKIADRVVEQTRANYEQLPEANPLYGVGHKGGQFIFRLKTDENADWGQAENENTLEAYRLFLTKYPQGKYAVAAKQKIDFEEEETTWNKTKSVNTLLAYLEYDRLYPNGKYSRQSLEATTRLEEEQAWKQAQERHLLSAYRKYILDYPQGKYRKEAEASVRNLSTAEQEAQKWNQNESVNQPSPSYSFNAQDQEEQKNVNKPETNTRSEKKPVYIEPYPLQKKRPAWVSFLKKHAGWATLLVVFPLLVWAGVSFYGEKQTQTSAKFQEVAVSDNKNFIDGAHQITNGSLGKQMRWGALDSLVIGKLEQNANIRIVSHTITSPTTRNVLSEFLKQYPSAKWIEYDSASCSAILEANESCFGCRCLPSYYFDKAEMIISFDADFLGSWILPKEYAAQYDVRQPSKPSSKLYHAQFESRETPTGKRANERIVLTASEQIAATEVLYREIVRLQKGTMKFSTAEPYLASDKKAAILRLAAQIYEYKGRSLVISGSNDSNNQYFIIRINSLLKNYGTTITFDRRPMHRNGRDSDMNYLIDEMGWESIGILIIMDGANPTADFPRADEFRSAMAKVGLKISLSGISNETTRLCDYVAPTHKQEESWSDSEPRDGYYQVFKPTATPSLATRQAEESLLYWAKSQNLNTGSEQPYSSYIQNYWLSELFPKQAEFATFQAFFWEAVNNRNGVFQDIYAYKPAPIVYKCKE